MKELDTAKKGYIMDNIPCKENRFIDNKHDEFGEENGATFKEPLEE